MPITSGAPEVVRRFRPVAILRSSRARTAGRLATLTLVAACSSRGFSVPTEDAAAQGDAASDVRAVASDSPPVDAGAAVDVQAPPTDVPAAPMDVPLDRGAPPADAPPPPMDVPPPPVDVPPPPVDIPRPPVDVPPPPVDVPAPPIDTGATGRGAYFDTCTSNADCAGGDCLATPAGARWCTRRCTANADCGHGNLCASGRCVPDDTGAACDPLASAPCARRCLANTAGAAGHCTRECSVGADCPAGYACGNTAGGRVCVFVERSCAVSRDCASGLCIGTSGGFGVCSAPCTADADCPRRMTIANSSGSPMALAPYRCQSVSGQMMCVPPLSSLPTGAGDIRGGNPLGASCGTVGGDVLCYSGVCDTGDNTCVQACTPTGGCPVGFACLPWQLDGTGGRVYLVCRSATSGRGAVGATCARASDCATGACQPPPTGSAYCTRYCIDGLCPTGMRCVARADSFDGTRLATCER